MAVAVASRTEYALTTAGTTSSPTFTQTTGHLVVIFLSTAASTTVSNAKSFNNLTNLTNTFHVLYKVLDGTEGGVVAITTASSKTCAIAYNITGAVGLAPTLSTVATGTSVNPNASICTPASGLSLQYLWITAFYSAGEEADDDTWITVTPTSFSNLLQKTTGVAGTAATNSSIGSAEYLFTATSLDATAFTQAQSLAWRAYTLAVQPAVSAQVTANVGEVILTGFAGAWAATSNLILSAGLGALTLTGFAPTLQTPTNINPNVGAITIQGFAPTWSSQAIVNALPGTGEVILSGFTPVIQTPINILADGGSILLTGYGSSLVLPRSVTTDTGVITLIGFPPTVVSPQNLLTDVGALSITGFVPIVDVTSGSGANVNANLGQIIVTGFIPIISITANVNLTSDVGLVIITGFAPSLIESQNTKLYPGNSVLTITNFAPTVFATNYQFIFPATGVVTLTGYEAYFVINFEPISVTGTSRLTGAITGVSTLNFNNSFNSIITDIESDSLIKGDNILNSTITSEI